MYADPDEREGESVAQVSARPAELASYGTAAGEMATSLARRTGPLGAALDAFRSTEGWDEFISDVPPLDIDLGATRGRLERLGTWVAQVGAYFARAGGDGEVVRVDEGSLTAPRLEPGPPPVVQDGERWIVNGSDAADHIQLVENDDGSYTVRVGRINAAGDIEYVDHPLTDEQAANLVIRSGGGDDVIEVPPTSGLDITYWTADGDDLIGAGGENPLAAVGGDGDDRILAGEGDDTVAGGAGNDEIYGGDGTDTLDGQDGDDRVVGGDDRDVLYGGRDDDVLSGGEGDDTIEGGSGEDQLGGGAGDDLLSGGRDDDVLTGGEGDDQLLGGRGADSGDGGHGADRATDEAGDVFTAVEHRVTIELVGDPGSHAIRLEQPDWMSDAEYQAWLERIDSDLELIRSTPSGREGLEALDDASRESDHSWGFWTGDDDRYIHIVPYGDTSDVQEYAPEMGDPYDVQDWLGAGRLNAYGNPIPGGADSRPGSNAGPPGSDPGLDDDGVVRYADLNPAALDERPPVASLYHELAHSFDQLSGGTPEGDYTEILYDEDGNEIDRNTAPRAEVNSVGAVRNEDGDVIMLETRDGSEHPEALTENALREDLGVVPRPSYTLVPDDDESVGFEDVE